MSPSLFPYWGEEYPAEFVYLSRIFLTVHPTFLNRNSFGRDLSLAQSREHEDSESI